MSTAALSTAAWLTVACLSLGVACSSGSDAAEGSNASTTAAGTTTVLGTGDGTFTVRNETFVDEARSTKDPMDAQTPGRALPTDIYVPGGEGPFPLIVHAHGMDGSSAKFSDLLSSWAQAGYIVVAPNFPRTNDDTPDELRNVGDYVNQPGDVSFVLDQVLAETEPGAPLDGLVATDHMAISGLSLGGATTYPMLFHPCCVDDRFGSAIVMSALELPFEDGEYDKSAEIPILAFAGTADTSVRYELQTSIIDTLPGPTWFVTLYGAMHSPPFENATSAHDQLVKDTTLDFWALTLRDDPGAADELMQDATVEGLSSVEYRP